MPLINQHSSPVNSFTPVYHATHAIESEPAPEVYNMWQEARHLFFESRLGQAQEHFFALCRPMEDTTPVDIRSRVAVLKASLKPENIECVRMLAPNTYAITDTHGNKIVAFSLIKIEPGYDAKYTHTVSKDDPQAGNNIYFKSVLCNADCNKLIASMESETNKQSDDVELIKPILKRIIIDNQLDHKSKLEKVLLLASSLFEYGPNNNFFDNSSASADARQSAHCQLKEIKDRGYLSLDYYRDIIQHRMGYSDDQARIAEVICQYNDIESRLIKFSTDDGIEHYACEAELDGKKYIIDPKTNILCKINNNTYKEYYVKLQAFFECVQENKELVFMEHNLALDKNVLKTVENLHPTTLNYTKLSNESYQEIQSLINQRIEDIYRNFNLP